MLKKIRITIATIVFPLITLLFLDFSGTLHLWFGWLAKTQLVPAILAVNITVVAVIAIFTLLFGRIYCSVICPLGVMQDGISNVSGRLKKNRFSFSIAKSRWRYITLALFIVSLVGHLNVVATTLEPFAAYGRIASNLVAPLYRLGNNLLAWFSESVNSYAFYSTEVWVKSWITLGVAVVTLLLVGLLAWLYGRTWCNTICPVGTLLGLISRFSLFAPTFNKKKCNSCGLCEKGCKASCIDAKNKSVDRSRCVTCFNCIEKCGSGAMEYALLNNTESRTVKSSAEADDNGGMTRRGLMAVACSLAATHALRAQSFPTLQADGGLADIADKKPPRRQTHVVPPGAQSLRNMKNHCVACQLCISACPNNVLRPSTKLASLNKPEMSFERGYCRPECVECSQVCPAGAIKKITAAEKSAISVGYVEWLKDNCLVNRDQIQCTSCERHCPTDAIIHVNSDPADPKSLKIPAINNEKCIGCGACEYYCPARPFSAIYVEGNVMHRPI